MRGRRRTRARALIGSRVADGKAGNARAVGAAVEAEAERSRLVVERDVGTLDHDLLHLADDIRHARGANLGRRVFEDLG